MQSAEFLGPWCSLNPASAASRSSYLLIKDNPKAVLLKAKFSSWKGLSLNMNRLESTKILLKIRGRMRLQCSRTSCRHGTHRRRVCLNSKFNSACFLEALVQISDAAESSRSRLAQPARDTMCLAKAEESRRLRFKCQPRPSCR